MLALTSCLHKRGVDESAKRPIGRVLSITDSLLMSGGSDTIRLGVMGSGEQLVFNYNLKNNSGSNLVILGHEVTCGCIRLEYDNKPVKSGEFIPMKVNFDSRGLYDWQLKLFRLQLYGAKAPILVYVEAQVE